MSADGVVWAISDGEVYRYERSGEGKDCSLTGTKVWEDTGLNSANDLDLGPDGSAYLLVFFATIAKLGPDGKVDYVCEWDLEDPPGPGGHSIAVSPTADRLWVISIGTDVLETVYINESGCDLNLDSLKTSRPMSTHPVADGDNLAVDIFDPQDDDPPAMVVDPKTGKEIAILAPKPLDDQRLVSVSDLVVTDNGYWATDGDGVWFLGPDGLVSSRYDVEALTGALNQTHTVQGIAYSPTGESYLAASWFDFRGIWTVDLTDFETK